MVFTEPRFLPFLLIVLALYWSFKTDRARKPLLLIASYVFYCAWDWRFLSLLWASTLVDWFIGLRIAADPAPSHRKRWLMISIITNLGILGFFKYFNFFVDSAAALCHTLGVDVSLPTLRVIVPPGVSFYTFMSLGYTIDVYRGDLAPRKNLLDYSVFVAFFPHLVAGPILRAVDFLKQLDAPREWNKHFPVKTALALLLLGFVKKACFADNVAPVIDHVFSRPAAYSTIDHWLTLCLYHVQVYCDFSGYTDLAIGSAGLLGYTLCPNFDFPYFASNVGRFWRRWHMSLSTWLKDYLYIPLGGSRRGPARATFNLFAVLILCGLWHGAGWKYVLFGVIHGVYVTAVLWYGRRMPQEHPVARVIHALGPLIMTYFLFMSWVVFRAVDWTRLEIMYAKLYGGGPPATENLSASWWGFFAALALVHWLCFRGVFSRLIARMPPTLWAFGYGVGWAVALSFASTVYQPFVYFQF